MQHDKVRFAKKKTMKLNISYSAVF